MFINLIHVIWGEREERLCEEREDIDRTRMSEKAIFSSSSFILLPFQFLDQETWLRSTDKEGLEGSLDPNVTRILLSLFFTPFFHRKVYLPVFEGHKTFHSRITRICNRCDWLSTSQHNSTHSSLSSSLSLNSFPPTPSSPLLPSYSLFHISFIPFAHTNDAWPTENPLCYHMNESWLSIRLLSLDFFIRSTDDLPKSIPFLIVPPNIPSWWIFHLWLLFSVYLNFQ